MHAGRRASNRGPQSRAGQQLARCPLDHCERASGVAKAMMPTKQTAKPPGTLAGAKGGVPGQDKPSQHKTAQAGPSQPKPASSAWPGQIKPSPTAAVEETPASRLQHSWECGVVHSCEPNRALCLEAAPAEVAARARAASGWPVLLAGLPDWPGRACTLHGKTPEPSFRGHSLEGARQDKSVGWPYHTVFAGRVGCAGLAGRACRAGSCLLYWVRFNLH